MTTLSPQRRKWLVFSIVCVVLLFIICGIFVMAVRTKTSVATDAIQYIISKKGSVRADDGFYSRGFINDSLHRLGQTVGYHTELGHKAYHVTLNNNFSDGDMVALNAIPYIKSLHLESPHITNKSLFNLHGSNLLSELRLVKVKCDGEGLAQLSRFKNLQNLSLIALDYVGPEDYGFVGDLNLETFTLIKMKVDPLGFSQRIRLPQSTVLSIENPRP